MPPDLQKALGLLFFMVAILLVGMLLFNEYGCTPAAYPAYCYNEAAFTAKEVECTTPALSASRAEARACKARVKAACGFVEKDGGAE